MLFKAAVLDEIRRGRVTLAFRRWTKPTVRASGTLRTPIGVLGIDDVRKVAEPRFPKPTRVAPDTVTAMRFSPNFARVTTERSTGSTFILPARIRGRRCGPRSSCRAMISRH